MKPQWNKKYTTIAIYSVLVMLCVAFVVWGMTKAGFIKESLNEAFSVLAPVTLGVILAYLLNPLLDFFELKVFKNVKSKLRYSKLRRGLSLTSTCLTVVIIIALIFMLLIPQMIESYNSFIDSYGSVEAAIDSIVNSVKDNKFFSENYATIMKFLGMDPEDNMEEIINKGYEIAKQYMPVIINWLKNILSGVYNAVIAFIFCIYILAYREKLIATVRKIFTSLFSTDNYNRISHIFGITDKNFGGFIKGKILDSTIIFVIAYVVYWCMGLKFYPILAFITGVTNVVPFFGPFIGAVPVGFIVLIAQPEKLIWTLLAILLIQQLDGNFIGPMILGDSVGISPVWIISSILVFGGLYGFMGMLFGVPLFATIYALIKEWVEGNLKKKELPVETECYYSHNSPPTEKHKRYHRESFISIKKMVGLIKDHSHPKQEHQNKESNECSEKVENEEK